MFASSIMRRTEILVPPKFEMQNILFLWGIMTCISKELVVLILAVVPVVVPCFLRLVP